MALPLSGIRVLDLGRTFAAPWCTQMLGDLGAEVIKVERPGRGDEMRHYGPPFARVGDGIDETMSAYFLAANRNKKSICIDLAQERGQEVIRALAAHCDVLMENFKVGDLARYGLDYPAIADINPDLVYCSITGFGQTGPYAPRPGTDSVFQAMSGLMSITGEPGQKPQKVGLIISDLLAGLYATIAIQAALREREVRGGRGQHIDISLLDVSVAAMSHRAMEYLMTGEVPQPIGTRVAGSAPAQMFRCKDGTINIQASAEPKFLALCQILGRPDLPIQTRFSTRALRFQNADALEQELERALASWTMEALFTSLVEADIICSPVYTVDQTFADPQVRHRGLRQSLTSPDGSVLPSIANPIRLSQTPIDTAAPPPAIGSSTITVLAELLGYGVDYIAGLRDQGVIA